MILAGIGSRQTPSNILNEMTILGDWAKSNGHFIYSGHADGADWAFELGAQESCVAFLPWFGFNKHLVSRARLVVVQQNEYLRSIVYQYHPTPKKLSRGAMSLMCRNTFQVLGGTIGQEDFDRAKVVICYTPDGKDSGGTGQAIRIAMSHGIPTLNMQHKSMNTAVKIIDILQRIENA